MTKKDLFKIYQETIDGIIDYECPSNGEDLDFEKLTRSIYNHSQKEKGGFREKGIHEYLINHFGIEDEDGGKYRFYDKLKIINYLGENGHALYLEMDYSDYLNQAKELYNFSKTNKLGFSAIQIENFVKDFYNLDDGEGN